MAAILPTQLIAGYSINGSNIEIPIASLSGLTLAEANATTGDGREVARALIETIVAAYLATPVANRPARMAAAKTNPVGTGINQITQGYNFTFSLEISQSEANLQAEPV